MPQNIVHFLLYYTHYMTLSPNKDPMGKAILDHVTSGKAKHKLWVKSTLFDDDEMPVDSLFRTELQMPPLERTALQICEGKILDVGAGAGCHTLCLEQKGKDVTSIDISPLSTEARRIRGCKNAVCADFFTDDFGTDFSTILFMMNGLGIAGKLTNLPTLLLRCKELLAKGGKVLADSSDLRYLFDQTEDISQWDYPYDYYGEVDYKMSYGKCVGNKFDWLYVDFETLSHIATQCGMTARLIQKGTHYDYFAEIEVV